MGHGKHWGKQKHALRGTHRIKTDHAHSLWIQFAQNLILMNILFHDSVPHTADTCKSFFYLVLCRRRKNPDPLPHALTIRLIDHITASLCQSFQQFFIHLCRLHAPASIKFRKYFRKDILIHQHTDITSVRKFSPEIHTRPQCRHGFLLLRVTFIISGPLIFSKGNMIPLLCIHNIQFNVPLILSVFSGIFRCKFPYVFP